MSIPPEMLPRGWVEGVGFVRAGGVLHVSFPKVYDGSIERLARDRPFRTAHLILLLRVLARCSQTLGAEGRGGESPLSVSSPSLLAWLDAAAELLGEFLQNGLYWVKQMRSRPGHASGTIDWGRTLHSSSSFLVEQAPVFLNPVRRFRVRSEDDLLHRLHATVVQEISLLLGGQEAIAGVRLLNEAELQVVRKNPRAVVLKLARSTFSDRGKRLLRLIARYFEIDHMTPGGASDTGFCLCRTEAFELLWEHMLRCTMAGGGDAQRLPAGIWTAADAAPVHGIGPRIDFDSVVVEADKSLYVIFDAKDKIIKKNKRTGSEQDHYKQIIYSLLIDCQGSYANALIFPTLDVDQLGTFQYLGCHRWEKIPRSQVHELAANYADVCSAFLGKRQLGLGRVTSRLQASHG